MALLEFTPDQIDERIKNDPEMIELAKNDPTEFDVQHASLYRSFGYKPDGSPLGKVQKAFGKASRATGISEGVIKGVASAVIPTATTIGGAMAGARGGPGGVVVGAAAGAVAGEFANFGLGITEEPPTPVDLGIAAGSSLLGPLASRTKVGIGKLVQRLPGAGLTKHPLAAEVLEKNIQHMRIDAEDVNMLRGLLDKVPAFKMEIPMVRARLKDELNMATRSLKPDESYINELNKLTKALGNKQFVSFKELMATEKDMIASGSENPGAVWSKLSGVLIDDMEAQLKNPKLTQETRNSIAEGVQSFKMYSAFNKRYQANSTLDDVLNRSITKVDGGDDMVRFNKKQFIKEMRNNKKLNATFEQTEIKDMEAAIENLGYLGAPPGGELSATGMRIHGGAGGILGLVGYAAGGYTGMLIGGIGVTTLLRLGVSSETGRRVVRYLATTGKGRIDVLELNTMLGKAVAGMSAGTVAGVSGAANPVPGVHAFQTEE